jgi:hypothetical protein
MPRSYEYDLYFPFVNEAGVRAADKVLEDTKHRLTEFFGGLTDFHHRSEGSWKYGGVTYHDEVVLLRMLCDDRERAREFLHGIQQELESLLDQQAILIIEREISRLE